MYSYVAVSVGRKPSLINWLSSSTTLFSRVLHATQHKWVGEKRDHGEWQAEETRADAAKPNVGNS